MDLPTKSPASNDAPQGTRFPYENVPIAKLRATLEEAGASMEVRENALFGLLSETSGIVFHITSNFSLYFWHLWAFFPVARNRVFWLN